MNKIFNFIKSEKSPVIGLVCMVFGLFQMYAKIYFVINPFAIWLPLDIFISVFVAFGFSIATTVIIVHTKRTDTPRVFAFFDFLGYMVFFANSFQVWYSSSQWAKIGGGIFIAILSAMIVYHFGEIFIHSIRAKMHELKAVEKLQKDFDLERQGFIKIQDELNIRLNELSFKFEAKNDEFLNSNELVSALQNELAQMKGKLANYDNLEAELIELRKKNDLFFQENTTENLKDRLTGYKASFTRAVKEGRLETAKRIKQDMINLADLLGITLKEDYLNHVEL